MPAMPKGRLKYYHYSLELVRPPTRVDSLEPVIRTVNHSLLYGNSVRRFIAFSRDSLYASSQRLTPLQGEELVARLHRNSAYLKQARRFGFAVCHIRGI